MVQDKSRKIEGAERWDEHAKRFDEWYKTFEGAVENHVDLELPGYDANCPQQR